MADAYTNLFVHVVFSTKNRDKSLTVDVQGELYPYLDSLARERGAKLLIVNGAPDHVHLLVKMTPSVCVSDLIKFLKANSSRWIRTKFNRHFHWQTGYAAFSVSRSRCPEVRTYIEGQEEHHRRVTFEEEFLLLLKRNEVEFEEEHFWG